jgi:hypothetical protein
MSICGWKVGKQIDEREIREGNCIY